MAAARPQTRRLGAVVSGYDIRPSSRDEVTSLGATFLELSPDEREAQQEGLDYVPQAEPGRMRIGDG